MMVSLIIILLLFIIKVCAFPFFKIIISIITLTFFSCMNYFGRRFRMFYFLFIIIYYSHMNELFIIVIINRYNLSIVVNN